MQREALTMRRGILFVAAALVFAAAPAISQVTTVSGSKHGEAQSCADINLTIGDHTARSEQTLTFAASEAPKLIFSEDKNSGINVTGWDQNQYSVTACMAAGGDSDAEAKETLSHVGVQRNGGQLSVTGPENDGEHNWSVILLVKAPKNSKLDLGVHNGPMSVRSMSGGGTLRAENGPIRLKDSSGDFVVETQNGPISYTGRGGKVKLTAENGPIQVDVNSDEWTGELTGSARNGPIQLMLPSKFAYGVEVENYNAPMSCNADVCENKVRVEGHHMTIGSSAAVIHLTTKHGPVVVQNRKKL